MRSVIEAKNVALDEAMEEERGAAMKEADSRVRELKKVKDDKQAQFAT